MTNVTDAEAGRLAIAALSPLLLHLPTLIVLVIGIVLGLRNRRKHPKTSRAAIIAFSIVLVTMLVNVIAVYWLSYIVFSSPFNSTNRGETVAWFNSGLTLLSIIGNAVAFALILMAIYKWRGPEEQAMPLRETPIPYDVATSE
jgi:hypothetical protein